MSAAALAQISLPKTAPGNVALSGEPLERHGFWTQTHKWWSAVFPETKALGKTWSELHAARVCNLLSLPWPGE